MYTPVEHPKKRGPVKRKPICFTTRFTSETIALLDDLAEQTGMSRTDVIEQSVRILAQQSGVTHAAGTPTTTLNKS